ncbi:MAG: hypothetical protein M1818_002897 [Claussenomyces sp. TS43310]|nr:MAG: hypothetical protein M1818_002897 [Claussenomyces sp. TS43310]
MKSTPLIINWHDNSAPIYSCHFEPHGKRRLATSGGDNNVRIWRIDSEGEDRKVEYLSTLSKHTQAVNVVRWAPKGEIIASAGDDGNVLLWVPAETHHQATFGEAGHEDKETWRVKHMCRSSGAEIYDLAWSPDAVYFIIGSMDNVARIYNAQTGGLVRQVAEHSHYVQGVAWDPLNEYVATQSSDRSVHIYTLRTKDGQFTLENAPSRVANHAKLDFPSRRISSNSPAPPDLNLRSQPSIESPAVASPGPSAPGTPTALPLPMNPPSAITHSRRSSFGNVASSPSIRRSASPAPSFAPLPAVMPMEASPKPFASLGVRNGNLYANETLTSFFRRLTFTPDGSLLLTPAGQYQSQHAGPNDKTLYEVINTVYIYTRGGINKAPIAHLPGHKKPSVVVKCSPILYTIRKAHPPTKHITIDTSSAEGSIPLLPEPAVTGETSPSISIMEPPPPLLPQTNDLARPTSVPKKMETETTASTPGPSMAFSLPYRMIYAVATQDSVLLYDTQQQTPLCVVSNLHCATFTDLTWSNDGLTLLMTSSDGFCSTLAFAADELGQVHIPDTTSSAKNTVQRISLSSQNTPVPTPTSGAAPASPFYLNGHQRTPSNPQAMAPSPPPVTSNNSFFAARPSSPTRSNSTSSVATQASVVHVSNATTIISNPSLVTGSVPSITAASSSFSNNLSITTPPQTPRSTASSVSGTGVKRDASESERETDRQGREKKRRIAPTLVSSSEGEREK